MAWLFAVRRQVCHRRHATLLAVAALLFQTGHLPGTEPRPPGNPYLGCQVTSAGRKAAIAAGVESPIGAVVLQVTPGAPAAKAGLARGDLVLQFGRQDIQCAEDLESALRRSKPDSHQRVVFVRDNSRRETTLVVGFRPVYYSLQWFTHAGGGYRLRDLEGWTTQSPERPEKQPEARYDFFESSEGNYRLLCFRSSWPTTDGQAALSKFVAKYRGEWPQAAVTEFQLAGVQAVCVGYSVPKERRTIWRISWVASGQRYVMNALGPPQVSPSRLPSAIADLLATMELLPSSSASPDGSRIVRASGPGPGNTPPVAIPSPPQGWIEHRAGSVRFFLPKQWQTSSFAAADEGRWLIGDALQPEATLSVVRDVESAKLLRGMNVLKRSTATLARYPAEWIQIEVEETHRKTRGLVFALQKPDSFNAPGIDLQGEPVVQNWPDGVFGVPTGSGPLLAD